MKKILFSFIILTTFLSGCNIINPDEEIPAYLKINKFDLQLSGAEGDDSHNIVDAHVYMDGDLLGVFELPCEIPILKTGLQEIEVVPGIYSDGVKSVHHQYAFYEKYTEEVNFIPAQTHTISPVVGFVDNTLLPFKFYEDFEDAGLTLDFQGDSLFITSHPDTAFNGGKSGIITNRDGAEKTLELTSDTEFKIPANNAQVYLEMDYRCNFGFSVGFYVNTGTAVIQDADLILFSSENEWKKVYVNLTEEVNRHPDGSDFRLYLSGFSIKQGNYIAVDNLRLLVFE